MACESMACESITPVYDEFFREHCFQKYMAAGGEGCLEYPTLPMTPEDLNLASWKVLLRNAPCCRIDEPWRVGPVPACYDASLPGEPACWLNATLLHMTPRRFDSVTVALEIHGYGTLFADRTVGYELRGIQVLPFAPQGEVCAHA